MKKILPTRATCLPEITATFERPEHLYIQFAEPLDSTQTNLVREICLKLQSFPEGFTFSYAIISGNLLEERLPKNPLRQSDAGGNVIHITRGKRRGERPSIEAIRTSILIRLNDFIQKNTVP